jgi:hypothetical protein
VTPGEGDTYATAASTTHKQCESPRSGYGRPTQSIEAGNQVNTQANVITDEQRVAALMTLFARERGESSRTPVGEFLTKTGVDQSIGSMQVRILRPMPSQWLSIMSANFS